MQNGKEQGSPEQMKDNQELLLKVKRLEDINNIMAHNLRGAAANIQMMSEMLIQKHHEHAQEHTGNDELTEDEILDYIQRSSNALNHTLDDMVSCVNSRLNDARGFEDCDVKDIVTNITDQLNGVILQKKASIILNLMTERIKYTKVYLENLLYNFISNAIKYARPGVPPEVGITTCIYRGRPILIVKDNGRGINMKKNGGDLFGLNKVFHQGEDSKGIGLYITRRQIESLGGRIHVKSRENIGTQFIVVL